VIRVSLVLAVTATVVAGSTSAEAATPPGRLGPFTAPIQYYTHVDAIAASPDRVVLGGSSGYGGGTHTTFVRALGPDLKPDPSFGAGGEITFAPDLADPSAVAIEPDGQILLVRGSRLYRLNRDGTRDASFGSGGVADPRTDGHALYYSTLLLYPDGRVLVDGGSWARADRPPARLTLFRYLPDGSPDESFGSRGHVEQVAPDPDAWGAPALQPDGGVVLLAASYPGMSIVRLAPNGQPDLNFGRGGGLAPVALAERRRRRHVYPAGHPLVTANGRIRIPVTYGERESVMRFGIVGLTANGKVDTRFGRRGLALGPRRSFVEGGEAADAAVLDRHGSILMAGSLSHADDLSGDDASIVRRFRPNGTLDRSFGHGGVMRAGPPSWTGLEELLETRDDETGVVVAQARLSKYGEWSGGVVRTFSAGYDRDDPEIAVTSGCHRMRVRVRDASPLERLVLRANGRAIRRTTRKRLRLRVRAGMRVSVTAVDAGRNPARVRTTVPRC
jgi:uncharacterized delta-60 repeat protein